MILLHLILSACVFTTACYLLREQRRSTPAARWPALAPILGLTYAANPPRMSGERNGRKVTFVELDGTVAVSAWLAAETSLRVECGPRELVAKRAGLRVPDAVAPALPAFGARLLARCSDKSAGPLFFNAQVEQKLLAMPAVDFIGERLRVDWRVPVVRDPDETENLLGALCALADLLETYPKNGAMADAQANRS